MVKYTFKLLFILMASALVFMFVFGDVFRGLVWEVLEPFYQQVWREATFNDGYRVKEVLDANFDSLVEVFE